ncbi:hypothetical protein QE152_g17024 [Popillia japonica]|uniref:SGNH hydrolase-type esterase domain-containing protein n=1 Tax=Popillia japonica TaxID=7064 RepID=A0AAW1L5V3_POPJA
MATTRASVKRSKTDKKYLSLSSPKKISNKLNNSYIILNQDEDILETNISDLHSASTQTETAVQDTTYIGNPYEQNKESCKILILGDSQCRHYSKLLRDPLDDNFELFGMIKPNAKVGTLAQNIENECRELAQNDYVIFMGGTNDMDDCYNSENIAQVTNSFKKLIEATKNTNLIVSTIPFRRYNKEIN